MRDYRPEAANFLRDDNDAPKQDFSIYRTTIADLVFYLFNKNLQKCLVLKRWLYSTTIIYNVVEFVFSTK